MNVQCSETSTNAKPSGLHSKHGIYNFSPRDNGNTYLSCSELSECSNQYDYPEIQYSELSSLRVNIETAEVMTLEAMVSFGKYKLLSPASTPPLISASLFLSRKGRDVSASSVSGDNKTSSFRSSVNSKTKSPKSKSQKQNPEKSQLFQEKGHESFEALPISRAPNTSTSSHPDKDLTKALQCQHFQQCSGCTSEWDLDNPSILKDVKLFFKDCGIHDLTFITGNLWEWRCRAKLAVRGTLESPLIGLYKEGTHSVIEIPSCRVHHPKINYAVHLINKAMREFHIQPYDESSGEGDLRYIQMSVTTYDTSLPSSERYKNGKVQVAWVWNSRDERSPSMEKLISLSQFLWAKAGSKSNDPIFHSFWVNFQTSRSNTIFGRRWRHIIGDQEFWEHLGGVDICLTPANFAQANTQAFNCLLYKLGRYVTRGSSVVDLYAGVGIIGLSLAATRKCRSVKCVEISKESKVSFERSVSRLPKSLDCSISWHCADVSESPIQWLEGSDVVVVDPPRKGLEPSVIDALKTASFRAQESVNLPNRIEKRPWVLRAQEPVVNVSSKTPLENFAAWPRTLIYVSCGWESFKQDCTELVSNNAWHITSAYAFNFFPGTDRIEVLAVFKCGGRKKEKKKKLKKKRKIHRSKAVL